MPIEIHELVIKATVSESGQTNPDSGASSQQSGAQASVEPIEKAVKEIMDILKRKNER